MPRNVMEMSQRELTELRVKTIVKYHSEKLFKSFITDQEWQDFVDDIMTIMDTLVKWSDHAA